MNQENPGNPNNNSGGDGPNNRRPDSRRRPQNNQNRDNRPANPNAVQGQNQQGGSQGPKQSQAPRPGGGPQNTPQNANRSPGQGQNSNNNRRRNNNNRNRPGGQNRPPAHPNNQLTNTSSAGFNLDRVYEKYLNLLDQHLIARRKYHDLFFRAEPSQKFKLEKNFYNTINDIREFESRLAPDVKELFEKRNNGYQYDRTYTSNHEIPIEGDVVPSDLPPAEPHYLQSQIQADYKEDTEESMGSLDDYLKYKNL